MTALPKNVLYYGKEDPLPQRIELRAGPLAVTYEDGDLRYLRLGDRELLRRVYVAVRDRNWGTVLPVLSNVRMDIQEDSFRITYDVENRQGEIDFFWRGEITGDPSGAITFKMDGEARSTFLRNRIGFCVLHPIKECPGAKCIVETADRGTVHGEFPRYISPENPFQEMRSLAHEVLPGRLWAEVRFEGDLFEMEDQRNWTDASYKTFCTPLRMPYPVEIQAGTKISQSVTLTLKGELPDETGEDASQERVSVTVGKPLGRLPEIGLGVANHGRPLAEKELERLRLLNLSHLRVDLHLSQPDCEAALRQATEEARTLGVGLEAAVFLTDQGEQELAAFASLVEDVQPPVKTWLIFHEAEKTTGEKWVRLAREALLRYDPQIPVGAGTNNDFVDLNRCRPPVAALDVVSNPICPQVHAFDNASLTETLEAQASTVESAKQFAGGKPILISPVTLKRRFNPDATGPVPEPAPGELPPQVDLRQMSLFGAGWTLGSLKYLAESGVASVTYYETTGWRGVMETEDGSPLPESFRSLPGAVFPLFHVLADVGELASEEVLEAVSSHPLKVEGLAVREKGRTRLLLANMTEEPQRVKVTGLPPGAKNLRLMDETHAEAAMRSPEAFQADAGQSLPQETETMELELRPYALARLDCA